MITSIRIDPTAIRFHVPHRRAQTTYSCGAASVRVLAEYYGFGPTTEASWRKILATEWDGTPPSHIARSLRHFGMKVLVRKNLRMEELIRSLDNGHPVICPIQAYGSYQAYRDILSGHYVIVIGYDSKNFYFEDSSIRRARGWMTQNKFWNRWHDSDLYGTYFNQSGLIIKSPWKPKREYRLFKAIEVP